MKIRRCLKCMTALGDGVDTCPVCGRVYGASASESFALRPGTILDGKYLVGEMLGQGGFGITYLGFDLLLEQKVAIKEYFPMSTGMVSREGQSTVVWSTAMMGKTGAERGFDSFLKEARKMAKLGGIPGVVGVKSVFIENETAYIVMDYIEGETLQKKLEREGPMDFDTCVALLKPVIHSLGQVHSHGIIHRDISPDNIMVQKDGTLILLDLGAAKDLDIQKPDGTIQSSQLVAKHGFSPFEQYGTTGQIGPWTDVYAMAATIYYCCTGRIPPTAVDRMDEDTLACQKRLTPAQFQRLIPALAVSCKKRTQTMEDLAKIIDTSTKITSGKLPKWFLPALAVLVAGILLVVLVGRKENASATITPPAALASTEETIPGSINAMTFMDSAVGKTDEEQAASFFWGQTRYPRSQVEAVRFHDALPGWVADAWDVSAAKNESVLAWMDGNTLHVAADGNIVPNADVSGLFDHFANLSSIDFGDCFDTSNVTNMAFMFNYCLKLTSLDLSSFDTSKVTDMGAMFQCCRQLTSLNVSGFDTSQVTSMGDMFYDCESLTSLDVSGFDTAKVIDMGFMFSYCRRLTSLDVSGFDTSQVTDMSAMFSWCDSLTSLDVSGFDTAKVIDMGFMFSYCESLTSLDVSGFDTSQVTDMSSMFSRCWDMTSLDVSGFDTSQVTSMGHMFFGCESLTSLDVSRFDTAKVTDMGYMFCDCGSLTSLDVSGFDTSQVTDMSDIFFNCVKLTDFKCTDKRLLEAYKKR